MAIKNENISKGDPKKKANEGYINALYQEKYGRDATPAELEQFKGKTVKDTANLILGPDSPYSLNNKAIGDADPTKKANDGFINSLYQEQYGRDATTEELSQYSGKTVRDASNLILGQNKSPFTGPISTNNNVNDDTTTSGKSSYGSWLESTGKVGQKGQLPQQDSMGRWRWINEDGSVFEQPGFSLQEGEDGWGYLGEHTPDEFTSAQETFNTKTLKDLQSEFDDLSSLEKKEYIDKAHKEMSQNFMVGLAQGQSDTISNLGIALETYATNMKLEDQQMDSEVQNTIDAMEASGLTFTGKARAELGDYNSAVGTMTSADRAKVLQNIQELKAIRSGEIGAGSGVETDLAMPRPAGIDDDVNPATGEAWTDEEKNAAWDKMFASDEWTEWNDRIESKTAMDQDPTQMTGLAGQGTYGIDQQLNRMSGARGLEGKVWNRNRQIQESSMRGFSNQVKGIVTPFEKMYGSAGLAGLQGPTLGGQSIYGGLSGNVFGSGQGDYQTGLGINVGNQAGNAIDQWAPTINTSSFF